MGREEHIIDRYLNEVSFEMGGSFSEQQAVRDELRAHIRENALELELGGADHDDAIIAALDDLGLPEEVGRAMRSSRGTRPLRRPLSQPEGALILERRTIRNLPPVSIAVGIIAGALTVGGLIVAYAWP